MNIPSEAEFDTLLQQWMTDYGHLCFNVTQRPENGVYVGKGSIYENPYRVKGKHAPEIRKKNIIGFYIHLKKALLTNTTDLTRESVLALRGRPLVCFCNDGSNIPDPEKYCHSMVLAAAAEALWKQCNQT